MAYLPFTLDELREEVELGKAKMSNSQPEFWTQIECKPEQWKLSPWGDGDGGFWVVGIVNEFVVGYNSIEEGFNYSKFTDRGEIDEYWCDQDELQWSIRKLQILVTTGHDNSRKLGPPEPLT